jgi:uncharacterized protein (TIGR02145 family)
MKTKILLFFMVSGIVSGTMGQNTIDLTFTAVDNATYVQLDSIKVMNRTQGGDTVLYWPDTVLSFNYVGLPEISDENNTFKILQNYPNPVDDKTTLSLYVPEKDKVSIIVADIMGRVIVQNERVLDKGEHSFRFTPGNENMYFFIVQWKGVSSSIKIVSLSSNGGACSLIYLGGEPAAPFLKASEATQEFTFSPGDQLLYIGNVDSLQSGILDSPEENTTYTLQFATNIPCSGTPTVTYEGQVYNTIQIFSQCWLKENLNVGTFIETGLYQTDNGIIEKYCYNNEVDSCTKYGGLYQWNEMMQYTMQQGTQGICPSGWHHPTDEEWKVLEGAVDSQYAIGDPEWDIINIEHGYDAGTNLKTTSGWNANGNGTDLFGFSGLPGGHCHVGFANNSVTGYWWTSTKQYSIYTYSHQLDFSYPKVYRGASLEFFGFSVRCVRDEVYIPTFELTFTAINNTSYVQQDSIKVMNRSQGAETMIYWPDTTLVLPGDLAFTPSDELLCISYADNLQSGMLDSPEGSKTYTFQFATNIPCTGTPTVEYEGQIYNTIQIFSQCWLKENLNVGMMIQGSQNQADNGILEKYCYENQPDSCTKYGGLYQWNEMMQYTTQQGVQGICPPGWHLPTDEEWKVLEGAVDSQYGIGDNTWDDLSMRGIDAGANLKTTGDWYANGNGTDLFGFSGLPGGARIDMIGDLFDGIGEDGHWWTSTENLLLSAWFRLLGYDLPGVHRYFYYKDKGYSVRCLRD